MTSPTRIDRVVSKLSNGRGIGDGSRDTLLTVGVGLAIHLSGAVTGLILARGLTEAQRGEVGVVTQLPMVLAPLFGMGLPLAAVYFNRQHSRRQTLATAWLAALAVLATVGLGLFLLVPWYLRELDPLTVNWFRAYLAVHIIGIPAYVSLDLLRAKGRTVAFNIGRAAPFAVNFVGLVALWFLDRLTLRSAIIVNFAGVAFALLALLVEGRAWQIQRPDINLSKEQISYGLKATGASLSTVIAARLDALIIAGFGVDAEQLAYYFVAISVVTLSSPLSMGVGLLLVPRMVNAQTPTEMARLARQSYQITAAGSALIAAGVAATAWYIVPAVFGPSYSASVILILMLIPGQLAKDILNVLIAELQAQGKPANASRTLFVAALVTVIGLAVAIPLFEVKGAAVVTSTAYISALAYGWQARSGS